jgi:ABC-type dipeptide/oligopeptide/nickel transport system permease subunit
VLSDQTFYFQTAQGLIETVIGVDLQGIDGEFLRQLFDQPILSSVDYFTMIPSLVMALLSSRFVIFWLMNLILLICVPMSVSQLSTRKGKVSG